MKLGQAIGSLSPASERAAWWREVFGGVHAPLVSSAPQLGYKPNGEMALFYRVDVAALTDRQLEGAVRLLSEKFGEPAEEVRAGILGDHGLPILAEDVIAVSTLRTVI